MKDKELFAGIDIGSSSIKYSVSSSDSYEVVASGRIKYPNDTFIQNNINISSIEKLFFKIIRNLALSGVRYFGIACMAPIMILVDSNLTPLSATPYNSLLGSEMLKDLDAEEIRGKTFNNPNVQMFHQKIMWFKSNKPRILRNARWILDLNGYIFHKFSGVSNIPFQDINTALEWGLLDLSKKTWDFESAELLGIDHMLPDIVPPEFTISNNGKNLSIGTVDTMVSSLGSIGMNKNKMFLSNGSTLCAGFISDKPVETRYMYNDIYFNGKYLVNGCNSQYSTIIDWAERSFRRRINVNEIDMTPRNVIFLPYLEGERCPLFDPNIRAAIIDIDKSSTNDDIIASAVHSLCYLSIDMIEHLKSLSERTFESVIAGGGLSKRNLASVISSLTGLNYEITGVEPTTIGAILISMKGNGVLSDYPLSTDKYGLKIEGKVYPNSNLKIHDRNYERFKKFREVLQTFYSA